MMRIKKHTKSILPNPFVYYVAKIISHLLNHFKLNNHYIRNELKNVKGSAVVLCNHVSSYDQILTVCATTRRMNYVVAESTYYSRLHPLLKAINVISKQQFFTHPSEILQMRRVIKEGGIILLFPAGLCTSDGVTTPLPGGTGKLLKLLGADTYVMKSYGMYLSNPKWSKIFRKGKVETECYKLFGKKELNELSQEAIYQALDHAMQYDEYEWITKRRIPFRKACNSRGLENILYSCPHCKKHFSIQNIDNVLVCTNCRQEYRLNEYGFFGEEEERHINTPADWHQQLLETLMSKTQDPTFQVCADAQIKQLNKKACAFENIGCGKVLITSEKIQVIVDEKGLFYEEDTARFFSLPMIPGEYFDLQNGKTIYRCYPKEPKDVAYVTDVIIALWMKMRRK